MKMTVHTPPTCCWSDFNHILKSLIFWAYILFDPNFSGPQNFLRPTFFEKNFFGPQIFWKWNLLSQTFSWIPKIIESKKFGSNMIFLPLFFRIKYFLITKLFEPKNILDPKVLDPKFFEPKIFVGPNFFGTNIF